MHGTKYHSMYYILSVLDSRRIFVNLRFYTIYVSVVFNFKRETKDKKKEEIFKLISQTTKNIRIKNELHDPYYD